MDIVYSRGILTIINYGDPFEAIIMEQAESSQEVDEIESSKDITSFDVKHFVTRNKVIDELDIRVRACYNEFMSAKRRHTIVSIMDAELNALTTLADELAISTPQELVAYSINDTLHRLVTKNKIQTIEWEVYAGLTLSFFI